MQEFPGDSSPTEEARKLLQRSLIGMLLNSRRSSASVHTFEVKSFGWKAFKPPDKAAESVLINFNFQNMTLKKIVPVNQGL